MEFLKRYERQSGSSFVIVVLSMALLTVGAVAGTAIMSSSAKDRQAVELTAERSAIRSVLTSSVDCRQSLAEMGHCDGSGFVRVYRRSVGGVKVLVSELGSRFGRFVLRAECSPDKDGIIVKATRPKGTGALATGNEEFYPEPLDAEFITWNSATANLLAPGKKLCSLAELAQMDRLAPPSAETRAAPSPTRPPDSMFE